MDVRRKAFHIGPGRLIPICILAVSILIFTNSGFAGDGSFQNGEFNFSVSVRFDANHGQLNKISKAFERASQVLADATDDQHRFGKITLVNNKGGSDAAEYWVFDGSGRAYAPVGKYGTRGEHVILYFDSDFRELNGQDGDAYTISHLHAHHAYGLFDSYAGPAGPAESAPFPDTETLNYSLMDNFFTRGGRAFCEDYTLNEFSAPSNHDPDGDTWQTALNGVSDWETVASSRFPIMAPSDLPVDAAPVPHQVDVVEGSDNRRTMLLIDRSGSMSSNNRLTFAKLGATQFVALAKDGDRLGLASFSETPSLDFPLLEVTPQSRIGAINAINSLVATSTTNIGGGLLTAQAPITTQSDRSVEEVIVLLSDGDHNTGIDPQSVIPLLSAQGVTVFTIGVGSGISVSGQSTLQKVAIRTGGRYFSVSNAFQLIGLFLTLSSEAFGSGLITSDTISLVSGDELTVPVLIETGSESATLAMAIANSNDELTLSLITPGGVQITEADVADIPEVDFFSGPTSQTFRIQTPEAGEWSMVVTAGNVNNGLLQVLAVSDHDGVQLNLTTDKNLLQFPAVTVLKSTLLFEGENVTGASISGFVRRPGGSQVPITLFDDGLPEHGDTIPNDGKYAAIFDDYSTAGTYVFNLTAESLAGMTYAGEELYISAGAPSSSHAVPDFTRTASTTAIVVGVP